MKTYRLSVIVEKDQDGYFALGGRYSRLKLPSEIIGGKYVEKKKIY
jgi:hypothetical protein